MFIAANLLVAFVGLLHFHFLALEMFLWQKPLGLKTFKNTPEKAEITAVLAANQGLYNGFLAAGLTCCHIFADPLLSYAFQVFFLTCVIVAGIYVAFSVSRSILWIQAAPAVAALIIILMRA